MDKDTTSQLRIWHRTGFGCRVLKPQAPYFVISPPQDEDRNTVRRRVLADRAGL